MQWLRYSGYPSVVCRNIFWQLCGSDTRGVLLLYTGTYLKIRWLRYSGNPSVVCRNKFWKFTGSDTREILLLYAGMYSENSMAQILGKSFCCMQEHIFNIKLLRYSGNPSIVCTNIIWKWCGSDTREILLLYANYVAQILGKSFCCMQECILKIQWLRYSGNPPVVCKNIMWKLSGSDTREILLLYARTYFQY